VRDHGHGSRCESPVSLPDGFGDAVDDDVVVLLDEAPDRNVVDRVVRVSAGTRMCVRRRDHHVLIRVERAVLRCQFLEHALLDGAEELPELRAHPDDALVGFWIAKMNARA
jgi:hypothetical protein